MFEPKGRQLTIHKRKKRFIGWIIAAVVTVAGVGKKYTLRGGPFDTWGELWFFILIKLFSTSSSTTVIFVKESYCVEYVEQNC